MDAASSAPADRHPYSERVLRALPPARRALIPFNRWLATPLFRAGLGWLLSIPFGGWILLLRTTGRTTGLPRDAGLCYAIRDGVVYVMAGFGPSTHWLRNIAADPRVEVRLPGGTAFSGEATEVTDSAEYVAAFWALDRAMGTAVRRGALVDREAADDVVAERARWFPIARIRPTGIAAGATDPGGRRHLVADVIIVALLVRVIRARRRRVS